MLGRQQIAGVPTAISELFKNAHDAYARRVEVDFIRSRRLFVLRDDGVGMSHADFVNRWLTLGTESKLGEGLGIGPPPSDPGQEARPILGEKGIGRLAIAAIGSQVLVLTRARESANGDELVVALVHWGLFALPGVDLSKIDIPVRRLPGGSLPSHEDVQDMIASVRTNLRSISGGLSEDRIHAINKDLEQFDVRPGELYTKLPEGPSLVGDGCGTHFVIQPTEETLPDDIDGRPGAETAPPLIKMLIGFTDTMTTEEQPPIEARFRDQGLDNIITERIAGSAFFSPDEFRMADHHVRGDFDEFGQFRGRVEVYGGEAVEYLLPWTEALGRPLKCGPFSINFAYVQGEARQSKLPPEEHGRISDKLNRIGGLYIYRDGIRILPYGNSDYDFLNIEQRRTKSAGYYFFSYRRIFGIINISRANNRNLVEKAGREGFRENRAYRELKQLLEHFFLQLAADFFREGGFGAGEFLDTRSDLQRKDKLRKQREKHIKVRRAAFAEQLNSFFSRVNSRVPEQEVEKLLDRASEQLSELPFGESGGQSSQWLMDRESELNQSLADLDEKHRIALPRGFGLTIPLKREWNAYRHERERLELTVFRPAGSRIAELVAQHAARLRSDLSDRRRLDRALQDTSKNQRKRAGALRRETHDEFKRAQNRALDKMRSCLATLENSIRDTISGLERTDTEDLTPDQFEQLRAGMEERILLVADTETTQLEKLHEQLKSVATEEGLNDADMTDALEEELEALRERESSALQLAQVGMALGIVQHEFSKTINGVRNSIRRLKRWADSNEPLKPLYSEIRTNFDHLDGYLTLFTPLDRRLQRTAINISGSEIRTFVAELFAERLERHDVTLKATRAFRDATVFGYPSSFYPCFVNLIDNSIFWLASRRKPDQKRVITLDAEGDDLIVADNGPGIDSRDVEAVFEMGFTRRPEGSGMGLYISRRTLAEVGFDLTLEPPEPGSGARFRISPSVSEQ